MNFGQGLCYLTVLFLVIIFLRLRGYQGRFLWFRRWIKMLYKYIALGLAELNNFSGDAKKVKFNPEAEDHGSSPGLSVGGADDDDSDGKVQD